MEGGDWAGTPRFAYQEEEKRSSASGLLGQLDEWTSPIPHGCRPARPVLLARPVVGGGGRASAAGRPVGVADGHGGCVPGRSGAARGTSDEREPERGGGR